MVSAFTKSFTGKKIIGSFLIVINLVVVLSSVNAQRANTNNSNQFLSLQECIDYALLHQPRINQSLINISIAKTTNAINLSGWLPQLSLNVNLTHYNQLPTGFVSDSLGSGNLVKEHTGIVNTTLPILSLSQVIFNPSLLYASRSKDLFVEQAEQITDSTKIEIVSSVTKSFYSLLLTLEQITVLKEDTVRLAKNLSDAYHQYVGGIVDMTDYQEAAISLNNSKSQLKQALENIRPQYAVLKQEMGYPPLTQFNVSFDTAQMKRDIVFDTTQELAFEKRIELRLLKTQKSLQHQVTSYYRSAYLPSVSAFFNYNFEFESNTYPDLYKSSYPYSYMGITLSMPLFTGFWRVNNVRKSKLQEQLLDWSEVELRSEIYTEYTTALADYKSNLYNLYALQDNVAMAKNVNDIVTLQYQQGVVAYLNVITAESNLITSEIGYLNALFQVLSSKVDLQKAMGSISYNR